MAITFVGSQIVTVAWSSIVDLPTTGLTGGSDTQARIGDHLIVATGTGTTSDVAVGVTDATLTWNEVAELYANDDNDANLSVSWAYASASPPATISLQAAGVANTIGILMVFRGVDTTTPMAATPTTATGLNSNTPNPAAIVPATAGAVVVVAGLAAKPTGDTKTVTAAPTNYTGFRATAVTGAISSGALGGMAYRASGISAGVSEDPGAFTVSATAVTNSWAAVTLALRPAPTSFIFNPAPLQPFLTR